MDAQEQSVWVFLGERAHWPSGVFTSRETAVSWIARHRLTGMITQSPVDVGVYDWAVQKGAFRPGTPGHAEPDFIGGFTTAAQEHAHFTDGVQD